MIGTLQAEKTLGFKSGSLTVKLEPRLVTLVRKVAPHIDARYLFSLFLALIPKISKAKKGKVGGGSLR
jgi:hypothetical protein